jgi:crotonobetainyl-CoA:carnitine CoA-transferase CaiB-like acyl-CoA transferase
MNALDGIRVLDFTHVWQGPIATQMLADFGADVIKVERPGRGDWSRGYGPYAEGRSLVFAGLNRNKRSLVVDLKKEAGMEVVLNLIERADVLVHNFSPGVVKRLGLDYETLSEMNPRLIHAHSSGWGDQGPYVERGRKGHARMAEATGGLFKAYERDAVPEKGVMSLDYPAGMILVQGVLLALLARERTGRGQVVSTDLLSAAVFAHTWHAGGILNPGLIDAEGEGLAETEKAVRNSWRTQDGYLEISPVFSDDALRDLAVAIGAEDLLTDPRFSVENRLENAELLNEALAARIREKTTEEWLRILESAGVLCAEIKTREEALKDPQVIANAMIISMSHPVLGELRLLGNPLRMSDTLPSFRCAAPDLGADSAAILAELGYDEAAIVRLRKEGVIA